MSKVSQFIIMFQLGVVPNRPSPPVTKGRSSGSAALPSKALATPAPSSSATSVTSSPASIAPAPINMVTFLLVVAAESGTSRLAHNRQDGLVIHFGVVEPGDEVRCSWP